MADNKNNKKRYLPPRVYFKHGAYYYVDKNNKWHWLGETLPAAMVRWASLVNCAAQITTMNHLFDRYMVEIAPRKAPSTYRGNILEMANLRPVFGNLYPEEITAPHIYKYLDIRARKAPVRANREKALLSHVFTKGIEWGVLAINPCRGVKRITETPRERYVEDWEYKAVWDAGPPLVKEVMEFAYLTGQRIGDILVVKIEDLTDEGIKVEQNKGNGTVKLLIEWSDDLKACVDLIRNRNKNFNPAYLFETRRGKPYNYEGFKSIWQRARQKAIEQGTLKEKFNFHDLRAKSSTDADDLQHASSLLGHTNTKITERVYRRKARRVKPLR